MHKIVMRFRHDRHKMFQLILTIGTLASFSVAVFWPSMAMASILGNLATTMIWIWE